MRTKDFIKTYSGLLSEIITDSTVPYDNRPFASIQRDKGFVFTSLPHSSTAQAEPNTKMVDLLYIDVKVDLGAAKMYAPILSEIMAHYPSKSELYHGVDPVDFARNCGLDKHEAYRLIALGTEAGIWKLMTPKNSFKGISREEAIARYEDKGFFYLYSYSLSIPVSKASKQSA